NGDLYIPNLDKSVQSFLKMLEIGIDDVKLRLNYDESTSMINAVDKNGKLVFSITKSGSLHIHDVVTQNGSVEKRLKSLEENSASDTAVEILKSTDYAIATRDDEALLNSELLFSLEELSSRYVFASSITRLSKKEFLVFCEARMGGDFGETKIFMRKVTVNSDYSLSLGALRIVADSGGVDVGAFSCINSCSLKVETGAHAGRIYLYYIKRFYNDDRDETYQIYSDDDGVTWSTPIDMSVFMPNFANWRIVAIGPGKAIQLKKGTYAGRIILPCWHGDLNYPASQAGLKSFVLYSDDGGDTYTVGAESIYIGSNECQVAELADGGFALLTRDASQMKAIEYSFDGGLTLVDARKLSEITTTMVQSGFLQPQNKYDLSVPKLVVSTPSKGGVREDIGLWVSYDEKTFNLWKILATGMASYSDLMPIDESHILITYSAGRADQNRDIKVVVVNLKSILLGA
ncbi:exo-alpha-sialidase, partial [Acinetobacter radioresistens]|uniref:exo-alpha-sialidase n=1 Tax=Acinetobacter radioresistens TaxID=40216 RepID=UPI00157AD366